MPGAAPSTRPEVTAPGASKSTTVQPVRATASVQWPTRTPRDVGQASAPTGLSAQGARAHGGPGLERPRPEEGDRGRPGRPRARRRTRTASGRSPACRCGGRRHLDGERAGHAAGAQVGAGAEGRRGAARSRVRPCAGRCGGTRCLRGPGSRRRSPAALQRAVDEVVPDVDRLPRAGHRLGGAVALVMTAAANCCRRCRSTRRRHAGGGADEPDVALVVGGAGLARDPAPRDVGAPRQRVGSRSTTLPCSMSSMTYAVCGLQTCLRRGCAS
jgi:hypothetical protein